MKYKFKLNGLDCPNCANKIEKKLNECNDIDKAIVNFSKQTVTIDSSSEKDILKIVTNIIHEIEPDVKVTNESVDSKLDIKKDIIRLILGLIFLILGIKFHIFIILSYITLLFKTTKKAIILLFKSHTINETLLITISCIGAYFTSNFYEGLMVIILYEIGKILESIAVNNSRKSIKELMNIRPEYANLKIKDTYQKVSPEEVNINDTILVKVGEIIPLDGIIIKGETKLDTSSLTGESKLSEVTTKDKVLSGSINIQNIIEIKVTKKYEESTVSKILDLVETATDRKAKTENFVAKAAKIYTPIVLLLAILIAIILPLISTNSYRESIYRALTFLVISCPCAIAISVPLSYFSGIGKSSKEGILIKGSDYLDSLGKIKHIIFDKTGTITTGNFQEYDLVVLDKKYKRDDIIKYYVAGEKLSNHPIAKSIVNIFNINPDIIPSDFEEITSSGIKYQVSNHQIKIGSSKFCKSNNKDDYIYLNIDNSNIAKLKLFDGIKTDAKDTINKLHKLGIKTKMYTGDTLDATLNVAKYLNIDEVKYELLPQDKYKLLEETIEKEDGIVAFIGDGINDAPSLKRADIGISMGGVGQSSAIEASDIVIMQDEISKIITGINISKFTTKIIKQNLIFAIGIKVLVLILSAFGITSMWQAVFADTGLTLLTILNTTRILKKKI